MANTNNLNVLEQATDNLDAAIAAMKTAQGIHANCLAWNYTTMRMDIAPGHTEAELNAAYAAVVASEKLVKKMERAYNKAAKAAR